MRVILEVQKSEQHELIGKRLVFDQHEAFMVGRKKSRSVQFRIPTDLQFSRFHFMIEVNPPHCYLRDVGSRNGTFVNGVEVRDTRLKDGDVIRGGRTVIKVSIDESAPAAAEQPQVPQPNCVPPMTPPSSVGISMNTNVYGTPGRPQASGLRCAVCHNLAEETKIGDLCDTSLIAYVCNDCRNQANDPDYPVPNYQKIEVLGRGTMGPVYKARRVSTDKLVTLKTIAPEMAANPTAAKLFLRQMLLAAKLDHPNIVPVVEMGQAGTDLWIATEFIDGVDARVLAERLGGTVPLADAVNIICQTLDALDNAHGKNLVHRDVKPSNILVTGQPGGYFSHLADFGLLRNMDEAGVSGITRDNEARGTIPFMPPEQVLDCRYVKPAGDIYATAATLYWLLTGRYVYDFEATDRRGETIDPYLIILDEENHQVIPVREHDTSVPMAVAEVIETALEHEPEKRFQSATEMKQALAAAAT